MAECEGKRRLALIEDALPQVIDDLLKTAKATIDIRAKGLAAVGSAMARFKAITELPECMELKELRSDLEHTKRLLAQANKEAEYWRGKAEKWLAHAEQQLEETHG